MTFAWPPPPFVPRICSCCCDPAANVEFPYPLVKSVPDYGIKYCRSPCPIGVAGPVQDVQDVVPEEQNGTALKLQGGTIRGSISKALFLV
jgi:hypothetical protein